MLITYQSYPKNLNAKSRTMHPISEFDGRRVAVKRGKRITSLIGRLIILGAAFAYLIGSIYTVNTNSAKAYDNKTSLNVSPNVTQQIQKSNEQSAVQVSNTPKPTPTNKPTPVVKKEVKKVPTKKGIYRFIKAYNGSKITTAYADKLFGSCGNDPIRVAKVIGIALAETGLGRDTNKTSNFYGWYPNRNKLYDPSIATMATTMCNAVGPNGAYKNIGTDKRVTSIYTGADGTVKWMERFNWAIDRMGVEK